ncbi:hypothetical protein AX16_010624 [Volvariella volvacea WC 439]|nr:hypothetical protein AX16_010624 [Volvariella volvacea WC 439]
MTSPSDTHFEKLVKQEEARLRIAHPTPDDIPSCISLFDDFISCSVIRNQIKSLYRYGERPDCSPKMEEFKFCLSIKSQHPEERRDAWIRRRAEWWAHRRMGKNSEDVWDLREEPLVGFPKPLSQQAPPTQPAGIN